jgi:hypothetical protein
MQIGGHRIVPEWPPVAWKICLRVSNFCCRVDFSSIVPAHFPNQIFMTLCTKMNKLLHIHLSVRNCPTEKTECQTFSPVVRIGSPCPLTGKRVLHPPLVPRGETLACRRRGDESQFRRRDRSRWSGIDLEAGGVV